MDHHESAEFERLTEIAYCRKIMEQLVEFELNPRNFTKAMRAQNALTRRFSSYDYNISNSGSPT
jgi:hypothetical protein